MERKCKCGNFFCVREHSGICPECGTNIFKQSTHDKNVSKKTNNLDMSKQQTAVEWLQDKLNSVKPSQFCSIETIKEWIEQAKELEKQRIISAIKDCRKYPYIKNGEVMFEKCAEQYYNDKYGK